MKTFPARGRCAVAGITVAFALLALPVPARAQLTVLMSGGFAAAYRQLLPEFERTTGISVTTASGASQGTGPETIGAQLRRGVPADVVIMTKEGLDELLTDGWIAAGTTVELARSPLGVAVRTGAVTPDIGTVDSFRRALLSAKAVAVTSTPGIYLTKELFPRLGVADKMQVVVTARGSQSIALAISGDVDLAILPVSELLHVTGIDFVGPIPTAVQFAQVFAIAVTAGAKEPEAANRLIAFLSSERATLAIRSSGMEALTRGPVH